MKPIAIIGAYGNMGKRYISILKQLTIPYIKFDEDSWKDCLKMKDMIHSVIICSPTDSHYENVMFLKDFKILCEKPLSKNFKEVEEMIDTVKDLRMVNQYEYLTDHEGVGLSYYNYFKSGADGIKWDCLNIIGLAKEMPILSNDSPLWKCQINGKILSIADMDLAYCKMIIDWVKHAVENKVYALEAHGKADRGWYR